MIFVYLKMSASDKVDSIFKGSLDKLNEMLMFLDTQLGTVSLTKDEIESEYSGTVTEICVKDGQPVEYGQVLMYVE